MSCCGGQKKVLQKTLAVQLPGATFQLLSISCDLKHASDYAHEALKLCLEMGRAGMTEEVLNMCRNQDIVNDHVGFPLDVC